MRRLVLPVILLMINSCANFQKSILSASPPVRILLSESDEVNLTVDESFFFEVENTIQIGQGKLKFNAESNGISVNGVVLAVNEINIIPENSFTYDDTDYRGVARILLTGESLLLINVLNMEEYLYGVLPGEIPAGWDEDALKAQAVAARTYAMYEIDTSRELDEYFDLYADTRSQVYKGKDSEHPFTTSAVDTTFGEVIYYGEDIIKSYFHACTGGSTESALSVFGEDRPYCIAVPSPYGLDNEDYQWSYSVGYNDLGSLIGIAGLTISSIDVIERTDSLRIEKIRINYGISNQFEMKGTELRTLLGAGKMKSTRANVYNQNNTLFLFGIGYGHGVGMGQWDAHAMAQDGYDYQSIISYFYPGTEIRIAW